MGMKMKIESVRIFCAQYAYACITTESARVDIRLEPGRGAVQSLQEYAAQLDAEILERAERAQLARDAAAWIEANK